MGLNSNPIDPSILKSQFSTLLPSFSKKSYTSLRIGCLFAGVGLGLLIGIFINIYIGKNGPSEMHSIAYDMGLKYSPYH